MPLYEYQCKDCKQVTEVIQKFSDPDLTQCKECGGILDRLLSAPSIRFKGSGWYVNDYGKSDGANQQAEESKTASPDKTSDSDKPKKSRSDKKNSKVA